MIRHSQLDVSLNLCSIAVEPVDSICYLGVILDSELSMVHYIGKLSLIRFFQLHQLRKLSALARLIVNASAYLCL